MKNRVGLAILIGLLGFTGSFSLSVIFSPYSAGILSIVCVGFYNAIKRYPILDNRSIIPFCFLAFFTISSTLTATQLEYYQSLSHIGVLLILYLVAPLFLISVAQSLDRENLRKIIRGGLLIVLVYCFADLFLVSVSGASLNSVVPRSIRYTDATMLGIPRLFGPAIEPNYLAYYLVTFGPLIWSPGFKMFQTKVGVLSAGILMVLCLTFSSAALAAAAIGFVGLVLWVLIFGSNAEKFFSVIWAICCISVISAIIWLFDLGFLIEVVVRKLLFADALGGSERLGGWIDGWNLFVDRPVFGYGFGFLAENSINVYSTFLTFLISGGIFSFAFFVIFYSLMFYRFHRLALKGDRSWLVSGLCSAPFLASNSLFFIPYFLVVWSLSHFRGD